MSYTFPGFKPPPGQRQHHPLPPGQAYYPLSLADTPTTTALAQPSSGWDMRALLLLLAAAAFGLWLYNRFFATKKKKVASNEAMYFTTGGPLRGLDRAAKRIKHHAQLFESDGYEGAAKDLREASEIIEEFTRRTREQTMES